MRVTGGAAQGLARVYASEDTQVKQLVFPISSRCPFELAYHTSNFTKMLDLPQDILRTLFGLTPAECRVALLLGVGHSPQEIAQTIGVSFETVRSHIKSIFSKTNVKRQGELIRLLLDNSVVGIRPNN